MRLTVITALLAPLTFAQTATVQLQRGIFLEETAGDLDGAIAIFRQILAGSDARVYEAEAQYHLGACLLKKGNKAQAARAFQTLMQKHPEETTLLSKASVRYLDEEMGFGFTVPTGWGVQSRRPYNRGPGMCADLRDPEAKAVINICAKPDTVRPGDVDARLLRGAEQKISELKAALPDVTLRPGSPQPGWLAGQRTLTILAEYNGDMLEWTTWVETEHTRSSIIVHLRAADFGEFRARFSPILESFRIP
jgi:tetratricopeptide (TPR) repeat protein